MLTTIKPGKPNGPSFGPADAIIRSLLDAAANGARIEEPLVELIRGFGFDSFVYGMTTATRPNRDSRSYVWTTLPKEWVAAYDQNSYIEIDPRVTLTWGRASPLLWDSATLSKTAAVRRFLEHAARYDIRSGVTITFNDSRHARIGVGFNSCLSPVSPKREAEIGRQLGALMLIATRFHDLFMANVVCRGVPPAQQGAPLSPRERQCLRFAAYGMTSPDIGIKLGITERTANFHFSNVISKLGVLNRQEAVAKAVASGLIVLDT
jgi:LuxR family transcriptional regulator, quorum-sensing system regulator LasR